MKISDLAKRIAIIALCAGGTTLVVAPQTTYAQSADGSFQVAETRESPILFNNSGSNTRQQASQNLRMGQLEEHIRRLNGQVEEMNHQMRQLQDQIRRMQEDNEFRFQELENRKRRRKRSQAPAAPSNSVADVPDDQLLGTMSADAPGPSVTDPIARAIGQPLDLSTLATDRSNFTVGAPQLPKTMTAEPARLPSSDPREEYDLAYGYILRGDYELAETSLRNFIDLHPNDRLAANAKYWLGESLLVRGRYREAADVFLATYTDYPTSDKAPDSLLKLGKSLYGMGERSAACTTYSELINKYQTASAALRRSAAKEMQRAQC